MTKAEILKRIEAMSPAEQLRLAADLIDVGKVDIARALVQNVHDVIVYGYLRAFTKGGRRDAAGG